MHVSYIQAPYLPENLANNSRNKVILLLLFCSRDNCPSYPDTGDTARN